VKEKNILTLRRLWFEKVILITQRLKGNQVKDLNSPAAVSPFLPTAIKSH
jgi:hypothetical protein